MIKVLIFLMSTKKTFILSSYLKEEDVVIILFQFFKIIFWCFKK